MLRLAQLSPSLFVVVLDDVVNVVNVILIVVAALIILYSALVNNLSY